MIRVPLKIRSRELLDVKHRKPYQTTGFIYKALEVAEEQIEEQHELIEKLTRENRRLKLITKRKDFPR